MVFDENLLTRLFRRFSSYMYYINFQNNLCTYVYNWFIAFVWEMCVSLTDKYWPKLTNHFPMTFKLNV